jgi:hypothetical protein
MRDTRVGNNVSLSPRASLTLTMMMAPPRRAPLSTLASRLCAPALVPAPGFPAPGFPGVLRRVCQSLRATRVRLCLRLRVASSWIVLRCACVLLLSWRAPAVGYDEHTVGMEGGEGRGIIGGVQTSARAPSGACFLRCIISAELCTYSRLTSVAPSTENARM